MIKRIMLVVLALVFAWMYMLALLTVIGHSAALPIPSWWNPLFPSLRSGILTWLVIIHTFAVLVASLPFALVIQRIYGHTGVWVALVLTVAIYVLTHGWTQFAAFGPSPVRLKVVTLFDAIKLLGFLPLLVWVFGAWPSNYRIERRVNHKPICSSVSGRGAHAER